MCEKVMGEVGLEFFSEMGLSIYSFEAIKASGRARSIGVSNYEIEHLEEMRAYATQWPPVANQVEFHPWLTRRALLVLPAGGYLLPGVAIGRT